jgi:DNA-binding transcriptional LysR family regulator
MLDPHRLRVFRSVVASGSVQAAADNLGMTPSGVSQHLSALARETGLVLFEREGRGITPTAAARELATQSSDVIKELGRLDDLVSDLRDGRSGRLSIGYFASAGAEWMPSLVKALTAEFPGLVLELVLTEGSTRPVALDIDLVIDDPDAPVRTGYRRTELIDDPFVVVVPRGHPLAVRDSVSIGELQGETWVSNELTKAPCHRIVLAACAAAGYTPRFAVQAQDHYTAIAFVAAGVGITVLPRLATVSLRPDVARVAISGPEPVRHLAALVRDHGTPHRAADRAIELLIALIARSQHVHDAFADG